MRQGANRPAGRPAVALTLALIMMSAPAACPQTVGNGGGAGSREAGPVGGNTAMIASAAYPGLGQLLNGAERKAAIVSVAEAALVAALVVEDRRTRYTQRMYEQTKDLDWYDEYSRHYDKRQTLIWWVAVAALYGLADAYVDANLSGFDEPDTPVIEGSFGPGERGGGFTLGVAVRF